MKPIFIAGPCVIESSELLDVVAQKLVAINKALGIDIIFKASFDKANRTSIKSFRGPGMERGLQMLADVKENDYVQCRLKDDDTSIRGEGRVLNAPRCNYLNYMVIYV